MRITETIIKRSVILSVVLFLVIPMCIAMLNEEFAAFIINTADYVERNEEAFFVWRVVLYGAVVVFLPDICHWFSNGNEAVYRAVKKQVFLMAVFFCVIELLRYI